MRSRRWTGALRSLLALAVYLALVLPHAMALAQAPPGSRLLVDRSAQETLAHHDSHHVASCEHEPCGKPEPHHAGASALACCGLWCAGFAALEAGEAGAFPILRERCLTGNNRFSSRDPELEPPPPRSA